MYTERHQGVLQTEAVTVFKAVAAASMSSRVKVGALQPNTRHGVCGRSRGGSPLKPDELAAGYNVDLPHFESERWK